MNKVEDFVTDLGFVKWVKSPDKESDAFWASFIAKNPDKQAIIQEARNIVLLLDFKPTNPDEGSFLTVWNKINTEIATSPLVPVMASGKDKRPRHLFIKYAVAASFAFLAALCCYFLFAFDTSIQTKFGESITVFLPDSTKVTLNGNSTLRYRSHFFKLSQREVWLEGEAFFAVTQRPDHKNFLVHTSELDVEVLGTRFNVNARRGTTKVVLEEGKVKLNLHEKNDSSLVMRPNELVEVNKKTKGLSKKSVDAKDFVGWKNNQLIFVGASLEEVAHQLEDSYGYHVVFENKELLNRKFTGSSSNEDINGLLVKLTKLFDLNIRQEGKTLFISSKRENPGQQSLP